MLFYRTVRERRLNLSENNFPNPKDNRKGSEILRKQLVNETGYADALKRFKLIRRITEEEKFVIFFMQISRSDSSIFIASYGNIR